MSIPVWAIETLDKEADEETAEFDRAVSAFEKIDADLWKDSHDNSAMR